MVHPNPEYCVQLWLPSSPPFQKRHSKAKQRFREGPEICSKLLNVSGFFNFEVTEEQKTGKIKSTNKIINGIENRNKEQLITVSHNTKRALNKLAGNKLQTRQCKIL